MNFMDNLRLRFTYGCLLSQNMMGWYARSLLITSIEIVNKWRNQFHSRDGVRLSMAIVPPISPRTSPPERNWLLAVLEIWSLMVWASAVSSMFDFPSSHTPTRKSSVFAPCCVPYFVRTGYSGLLVQKLLPHPGYHPVTTPWYTRAISTYPMLTIITYCANSVKNAKNSRIITPSPT